MAYAIRRFAETDAAALSRVTLAAIRIVGATHYSNDQIDAWAARHPTPDRFIERARTGASIFVATDKDDEPVAYALLEPDGHLDMLYCSPDHTRKGLADELLAICEQEARTGGLERIYTEASELARPAFERAGYLLQDRRDFEIDHNGAPVAIHNYAMNKPLS